MTDTTRDLLISLVSHMAYMQGQLEAHHEHDDPEDYYWYRESVLLRQKVTDALADEPAVPEGREPAAVTGQPSDEDCWQWYTYCPEEGLEMYSDREQAQSAAQSIMGSYEVAAHSDGWHEDMESVSWGMLVPVEQAQVVECKAAEPNDEFDEWVKYELRPALYGHQPAPPADGEVAELVAWLQEEADDYECIGCEDSAAKCNRTAELLQRQVLVPVSVSERLPGPEDCNAEGKSWLCGKVEGDWRLINPEKSGVPHLKYCFTHWLPAHALPLPEANNG